MANQRNPQDSYDSSASHFLNQTTGGGINPAGNLTTGQLGELAESFHSEDFDEGDLYRKPSTAANPLAATGDAGEEARKAMRLKEREREARRKEDQDDFSSLLDQQEDDVVPLPRYASVTTSNPFTNSLTTKQQQGSTFGHNSGATGGGGKAAALFELSTVISEASDERKSDSRDDSVMLKEGLGKNVEDSMISDNVASPRIIMGSRLNQLRPATSKSALGGKKEGKAKKETKQPQHLSLRDQENVIDEVKKENFSLKLKIYFLEDRLSKLSPDQIDLALKENIELQVQCSTIRHELKRYKKLLFEAEEVITSNSAQREEAASSGNGGRRERELERMLHEERAAWERERVASEAKIKELMRDAAKRERGLDADDKTKSSSLQLEVLEQKEQISELLSIESDLNKELDEYKDRLEVAEEDIDELKKDLERAGNQSVSRRDRSTRSAAGEDVEEEIQDLRKQLSAQIIMLSTRAEEKEDLQDEIEQLKGEIGTLESELDRLEGERERERRESGSEDGDEKKSSIEEINELRDSLAALSLTLQEKEVEIEELLNDLDKRDEDLGFELQQKEKEVTEREEAHWTEVLRESNEIVEERDREIKELVDRFDELSELREQDAGTIDELNNEIAEKENELGVQKEEVEALTYDLNQLAKQIAALEDEIDEKTARLTETENDLAVVDKELEEKDSIHEQVIASLKEKLSTTKAALAELQITHSTAQTDLRFLNTKNEELALSTATLSVEIEEARKAIEEERSERELDQQEWVRQRREEEAKWSGSIQEKENAHKSTLTSLTSTISLLKIRTDDLQMLQSKLNEISSESELKTNDKFAIELELERVKRDLARVEDELDNRGREAEMNEANLRSEQKDLSEQLSNQIQTRLNLTDKLDKTTANLRTAQNDLISARDRLSVVEDQLNTDHKTLNRTEGQYRNQLDERNTLLLTVYQYVDKVVKAVEKTPKKGTDSPKPFTNFSLFNESLISRLKQVAQLKTLFEKSTKEIEARFNENFTTLKRQQEAKLRQVERLESVVKAATDTQKLWRQRVAVKQAEVDAAKASSTNLQSQLAAMRLVVSSSTTTNGDSSPPLPSSPGQAAKLTASIARATQAERRLVATTAQLTLVETKFAEAKDKVALAEGKWETRLKELEMRAKASDERVRREREGAKDRVKELGESIKNLELQVQGAGRRNHQLEEVIINSASMTKEAAAIALSRPSIPRPTSASSGGPLLGPPITGTARPRMAPGLPRGGLSSSPAPAP